MGSCALFVKRPLGLHVRTSADVGAGWARVQALGTRTTPVKELEAGCSGHRLCVSTSLSETGLRKRMLPVHSRIKTTKHSTIRGSWRR